MLKIMFQCFFLPEKKIKIDLHFVAIGKNKTQKFKNRASVAAFFLSKCKSTV